MALYARFHAERNIRSTEVVAFLRGLLRHLRGPVVLLWDRSRQHRAHKVEAFRHRHPRLHVDSFPGYAPELNPDEFVWNHLKRAVANGAPYDTGELRRSLRAPLRHLQGSQKLLWSCIHASKLPWP